MKLFSAVLFYLLMVIQAIGQNQPVEVKRSNNKVSLGGTPYYIHIVRNGESLFAISQAYNVSIDTIRKDNLHLTDAIKVNQYVKIRVQNVATTNDDAQRTSHYIYHTVEKGDTPYNLAIKYGITIYQIYSDNPSAKLGIRLGESLKIPAVPNEKVPLINELPISSSSQDSSFIIHKVEKKQTLTEIAAIYQTSENAIISANGILKENPLQTGQTIKIKVPDDFNKNEEEFIYHKVKKSETIYGLEKKYNIKERNLYKLNPSLSERMLQDGELIKLPRNEYTDTLAVASNLQQDSKKELKRDQYSPFKDSMLYVPCPNPGIDKKTTYKIALFLPFYFNINDTLGKYQEIITRDAQGNETATLVPRNGKIEDRIYPNHTTYIEFYQGTLLALYDLKKMGINLEVKVIDTRNDSAYAVEMLKKEKLDDCNLFIGPVLHKIISVVSDYARDHHINVVSPLSVKVPSDFIDHNPYAFQVTPPFDVQMQYTADFLNEQDTKNFIVIHDGNNEDQEYIAQFKKQLFSQMNKDNFGQIKYNEVYYYDAQDSILKDVFTSGIKNIVIIPSDNQAFVTDVIGKLNGYSYEYDITLFGQPRWLRFDNIELEHFYNTNTHIFSNSYIDYNKPSVIDFVEKYRNHFKGEPDKYSFQGYDITKYFCIALNTYGNNFRKCQHSLNIDLLQTKLHLVPVGDHGGYQNTAIYMLEFTKEFQLIKTGTYPN
ncbi:MAG: LysM peptidoglycan-binding domain-containing protein [Salinivirgaceae bacterium]